MAFIKVEDFVINTSYIAAVKLESRTQTGEGSVALLVVLPIFPDFPKELASENLYSYEWIEFTGHAARALRDYFSSFNNVIDLLPQHPELATF